MTGSENKADGACLVFGCKSICHCHPTSLIGGILTAGPVYLITTDERNGEDEVIYPHDELVSWC